MLREIFRAIFGLGDKPSDQDYPRYCQKLRELLESGRPYTLSELQVHLGKRKGTLYHEMTELRRSGFVIKKQYDRTISANKYRIAS